MLNLLDCSSSLPPFLSFPIFSCLPPLCPPPSPLFSPFLSSLHFVSLPLSLLLSSPPSPPSPLSPPLLSLLLSSPPSLLSPPLLSSPLPSSPLLSSPLLSPLSSPLLSSPLLSSPLLSSPLLSSPLLSSPPLLSFPPSWTVCWQTVVGWRAPSPPWAARRSYWRPP